MNNYHKSTLLILFLVLIILCPSPTTPSNPTPLPPSTTWKDALHSFFFPSPNIDFRVGGGGGSSSSDDDATASSSSEAASGSGSGGVKHAATMSFDTLQESAKSAANLAKEAARKLQESPHHSTPDL